MKDFKGKNVVITGAGLGMGRGLALKLAEEGANVAICDVRKEELEDTAKQAREKGVEAYAEVLDITDTKGVYKFRDNVHKKLGKVDMLINNAGVVHGGMFLDIPDEQHRHTMEVNIMAIFWMTKAFLPDMVEKKSGYIVNIASAAGLIGVSRGTSYSASKFGAVGFTDALRNELRATGLKDINFTVVCPSFVSTGMFDGATAPKFTPFVSTGYMVHKILEAVKKNKLYVLEPHSVKITPVIKALLPSRVWDRVGKFSGMINVMDTWQGRGDEDEKK